MNELRKSGEGITNIFGGAKEQTGIHTACQYYVEISKEIGMATHHWDFHQRNSR